MSKPKHSQGPWADGKDANGKLIQIERPGDDAYTDPDPERVANFHLVNAAPDLLKEMERYLPMFERIEKDYPGVWVDITQGTGIATLNAYRLAILRAKGEAQ